MDKDTNIIKKIGTVDKFIDLRNFCENTFINIRVNQISVQVSDNNIDFEQSAGRLTDRHLEFKFSKIHPEFENTILDSVINNLPFRVWRTRLMIMPPGYKYTIHKDPTPRVHIPIITDPKCICIFPDDKIHTYLPADGSIYWIDTRRNHTYENNSDLHRIHLVGVVIK